ncbi:MAG: adenosylmethionine--8-amino-7-oxononanoate transaminase [Candidatus Hydrogenedentes bacterium]|nr:adenosylmethionine--8-amino-7-oxononanoate transaminase [Candidatus Hydrogenedentota bacterium]
MAIRIDSLQELDYKHLWHPYTGINAYEAGPFVCFNSAEGVYLFEQGGRKVLDGISSWWSVALGHGHPHIVEAIREQAGVLQQSILGNQTHPLAIKLAARLAEITPRGLEHCYFAADGASATEAALKMAIQYWHNIGQPEKTRFVSLEEGYHGDTLGAVGVGFVPTFHAPFAKAVVKSYVADMPHRRGNPDEEKDRACALDAFASMERLVREHQAELAGVILEPLCQGAAGIRIYHPEYLRKVRALCDEYDLILIADEIAVGFGRTGSLFACDEAGIAPDILCLGKALTGGYLPASAAIANDRIYDSFRSDELHDRTFYDGHTFCGNPITSAAALAALDIFTSENIVEGTRPLAEQLAEGMARLARHDCVEYYQTLGMIGMIALKDEAGGATLAKTIARKAMELGLFIRPLGEVLYLWPPLVTTQAELAEMLDLFDAAIAQSL